MTAGFDFSLHGTLDTIAGRSRRGRPLPAGASDGQMATADFAAEMWYIDVPASQFLGSVVPFVKPLWGPNTGYAWAIQRLTCAGLAGTDSMLIYRGFSGAADVQPQNIVGAPLTAAAPTITPGKSGLILMPEQSLVFAGTLTGATVYTISGNAVQMTVDRLPRYLE